MLFPNCIDEYIEKDAPVRLFDAFVDSSDMDALKFERSTPPKTGTPGYDPSDLLKLYIYDYFYQVRSSRKLARECKCNVEIIWLGWVNCIRIFVPFLIPVKIIRMV